jgi:hypothetical protein
MASLLKREWVINQVLCFYEFRKRFSRSKNLELEKPVNNNHN